MLEFTLGNCVIANHFITPGDPCGYKYLAKLLLSIFLPPSYSHRAQSFTAMSHTYICTTLLLPPDIAYPFMPSAKVVIISASGSRCPAAGLSAIIYHNTTTPPCDISKRLTYAVLPPWLSIHPIVDLFVVSKP